MRGFRGGLLDFDFKGAAGCGGRFQAAFPQPGPVAVVESAVGWPARHHAVRIRGWSACDPLGVGVELLSAQPGLRN